MTDTGVSSSTKFVARLRDLEHLFGELLALNSAMLEVVQRKLVAMQRSETQAIQQCVAREGELAAAIREREGLRRRLMVLIGQDLGLGEPEALKLSISGLVGRIDQGSGVRLRARGEELSGVLAQIAKVNALVATFARTMLDHYRAIFAILTASCVERPVYARFGVPTPAATARVFDTTG